MTESSTPKWTDEIPVVPGLYWMRALWASWPRRVYHRAVLVRVRIVHEHASTYAEYHDPLDSWKRPKNKSWWSAPQALWWPTQVVEPPDDLNLSVDDGGSEPSRGGSRTVTLAELQYQAGRLAGQ